MGECWGHEGFEPGGSNQPVNSLCHVMLLLVENYVFLCRKLEEEVSSEHDSGMSDGSALNHSGYGSSSGMESPMLNGIY